MTSSSVCFGYRFVALGVIVPAPRHGGAALRGMRSRVESSENSSPLYCEQRLGAQVAEGVIELVERATGNLCPCKRGLVCPLKVPPAAVPAEVA